jgi:RNA recognition motif-containing protein
MDDTLCGFGNLELNDCFQNTKENTHSRSEFYEEIYFGLDDESPKLGEDTQSWLFVGRMNSHKVTTDLVIKHFQGYGRIIYLRLYNRGAIGPDKVPVDAYAIIRFDDKTSIKKAIQGEHGNAWLGTTLKCDFADLGRIKSSPINTGYSFLPKSIAPPPNHLPNVDYSALHGSSVGNLHVAMGHHNDPNDCGPIESHI